MTLNKRDYDAIVVGSGPNGFAAAITLQRAGLSILLIEAKNTIGGGMRSTSLTLPGFVHDVCSAVHPLAVASSFFQSLPWKDHGLEFIYPPIAAAHPFDDGTVAALHRSIDHTAQALGGDAGCYANLVRPLADNWEKLRNDVLAPLLFPRHPVVMGRFGLTALRSATAIAKRFRSVQAKGFWAGMAAHSVQDLSKAATSAIALILLAAGHADGWPLPKGGSESIANALHSYFVSLGGVVQTGFYVQSLSQLPSSNAVLFDVAPRQLLQILAAKLSAVDQRQFRNYRYGMGVFKIDWALDDAIPFRAGECRQSGTVHLGNSFAEIAESERLVSQGQHPQRPFVLLTQPSLFDATRAPKGKHVAWAYCHVPNGSAKDMTVAIEKQVERFAPGFRDRIIARHTMNTQQMEEYNPNYIGGDISGGMMNLRQLFARPSLRLSPYKTSAKSIYICSASTPPGGGVHGMCGYHAARRVLQDIFKIRIKTVSDEQMMR